MERFKVGHIVIGAAAELRRVDAGFCDIMAASPDRLLGRTVLDVTAAEDRDACRAAMTRLRETGEPYRCTKRLLRPDGGTIWVTKTVSIADFGADDRSIVATVVPVADPGAVHLAEARRQVRALSDRSAIFGQTLLANPGWAMLLAAFVIETERGVADLEAIAAGAHATRTVTARWARALVAEGMLVEQDGRYRLTPDAHALFDRYLAGSTDGFTQH